MPTYSQKRISRDRGRETFRWSVPDVAISECPVSYITQESFDLARTVNDLMTAKETTGSTIAADEMAGSLFDAIRVCSIQDSIIDEAKDEAEANG